MRWLLTRLSRRGWVGRRTRALARMQRQGVIDPLSFSPSPRASAARSQASDDSPLARSVSELGPAEPAVVVEPPPVDALEASHDEASSPSEDEGAENDAAAADAAAPPGAQLQIHLFPTYATQEPGGSEWRVQVHGWCARRSLTPRLGRVA